MAIQRRRDSYITARKILDQMGIPDAPSATADITSLEAAIIDKDYTRLPSSTCPNSSGSVVSLLAEHRLESCGWFYPRMSREHAKTMLERLPTGYFLIRTSSLSDRKYTLSVRVDDGVVNIRIGQLTDNSGITLYHLDCSRKISDRTLEMSTCVVSLIEKLANLDTLNLYQFTDNRGQTISLKLTQPALTEPHSLKHLCRLKVNSRLDESGTNPNNSRTVVSSLGLPNRLKEYLIHYPNEF